ncbi:MAG: radical SAM protein [Atopobiaceae bacterium]|nr:radical SAM protein [Atopobiaceae bacterium]
MTTVQAGVSPALSEDMLHWALRALKKRSAFEAPLEPVHEQLAQELLPAMPNNFLPDVYLLQPLLGDALPQAACALDARERNYLQYKTGGAYCDESGIVAATAPKDHTAICGLVADAGGRQAFCITCDTVDAQELSDTAYWNELCAGLGISANDESGLAGLLRTLQTLPLQLLLRDAGSSQELVIILPRSPRELFWDKPYRSTLLSALAAIGVDSTRLASLERVGMRCGVPCYSADHGFMRWGLSIDVSHFSLCVHQGQLLGCTAGVRITERTKPHAHSAFRPARIHQWHITDICDQRCKHCYLFAEDAQKACISMPFEELMHILDEVERHCARRHMLPSFAITGGDPILHPRFWDFAQELHRRGFLWAIMGNPFHLSNDVCRRLRELGCVRYQLSLDGLRDFHDSLRKPGSFDATIAAIRTLRKAGIIASTMATASKLNLSDILACMDIAAKEGVGYFAFARYCATSPEKVALYPTPEEYRAFLLAYYEKRRRFMQEGVTCEFRLKEHLFTLLRYELGEFEVPEWSLEHPDVICDGCHLGQRVTIASNGDLLACRRMESVVGNITTSSLTEVEEGEAMQAYRKVDAIQGCQECKLLMWCRGCRAVGYNATGDLQAADPMCWHCVQAL